MATSSNPLRFGAFFAPFHPVGQSPTLALAREVAPHFQGQPASPRTSHDWATARRGELFGRAGQAIINAVMQHVEEKSETPASTPSGGE